VVNPQTVLKQLPAQPVSDLEGRFLNLCHNLDAGTLRYWSGFLAGIAVERERQPGHLPTPASGLAAAAARATVLYASQTGNGRRIAEKLHRRLESHGLAVRLVSALDYKVRELVNERLLYLVVSTHGDGDPPDDARSLVMYLTGRKAPRLDQLHYTVLALGDSSYPKFCETGRVLDERLADLGATRLADRCDADTDYHAVAESWAGQALELARERLHSPHITMLSPPPARPVIADRDAPVELEVLASTLITAPNSDHPVTHLELAAPAGELDYQPGDALGIWHENPGLVVDRIVELIGADPEGAITVDGQEESLRTWLTKHREVTRLARPFLNAHADRARRSELDQLRAGEDPEALRAWFRDGQVLDLLERFPAPWSGAELVSALRPLSPRLYSIASARTSVGDEVHLTVAGVEYLRDGERRIGAASHYLAHLGARDNGNVRAYIEPNERFRLPSDTNRDIIMIGPGTGVAPFRGFLQERIETGARGRNWLFFGARHRFSDFLYQTEWLEARHKGMLHRLDVAFSRDQREKRYVQHRIREQGAELARWIEAGAHLYVCGDAQHMAVDVHEALLDALMYHTQRTREAASEFLGEMGTARRYARDVY
jgi:sulfite reductase (NADPH) flavoprotein alpha-component